jgi:hypothetical protein
VQEMQHAIDLAAFNQCVTPDDAKLVAEVASSAPKQTLLSHIGANAISAIKNTNDRVLRRHLIHHIMDGINIHDAQMVLGSEISMSQLRSSKCTMNAALPDIIHPK